MANIKSAKKRILVNQTKADRNKAIRSAVKTSMKKVDAAVAANDKEAAAAALVNAISTIDKAASKGVYHKNNAARKVSNLSKAVNSIANRHLFLQGNSNTQNREAYVQHSTVALCRNSRRYFRMHI